MARELLLERPLLYLGADEVAAEMRLGSTGAEAVRAGRLFLERIEEALRERRSVLLESTLSGLTTLRLFKRFHDTGYDVTCWLVFVDSAEECVARIRTRVLRGEHHVPDEDVAAASGAASRTSGPATASRPTAGNCTTMAPEVHGWWPAASETGWS